MQAECEKKNRVNNYATEQGVVNAKCITFFCNIFILNKASSLVCVVIQNIIGDQTATEKMWAGG